MVRCPSISGMLWALTSLTFGGLVYLITIITRMCQEEPSEIFLLVCVDIIKLYSMCETGLSGLNLY
jgi:hypothetical protein